jgi:cytochrome c peroxidase
MVRPFLVLLAASALVSACNREPAPAEGSAAAPEPLDPRTSPLFAALPETVEVDAEKVELGRLLYHDPRLSSDGTISCASCHSIADGGDDGRPVSPGVGGQLGGVNSPTTLNAAHQFVQFWDGRAATLEEQAAGPVANPIEMGHAWDAVVAFVAGEPAYAATFATEYPDGVTQANITHAIAEFERTLITPAPWDRYLRGDDSAMTAEQLAGFQVFQSVGCTSCHSGMLLGGASYQKFGVVENYFEDRGNPTDADNGRFNVTGIESDRHKFKVPTLRNVTLTAPYFHDGSHADLTQAVITMARYQLGRTLSAEDAAAIVTFLGALEGDIPEIEVPTFPARAEAPAAGSGAAPAAGSGAAPAAGSGAAPAAGSGAAPAAGSGAVAP